MKLIRISTLVLVLLTKFSAGYGQTPVIKVLGTTDVNQQKAVSLKSLHIEVQVYGNIATTVMTMSFINNSYRTLEGELTFPMPDGVSISRYALDINGKMREAVPVEKARATEVFESIEHRRVDPGLLEKVEGNNFRTRIYPFLPGGTRTIMISYEEELHLSAGQQLSYRLPLDYKQAIPEFSLKATVSEGDQKPVMTEQPDGSFSFKNKGTAYIAEMQKKNFLPEQGLIINLPGSADRSDALMQKAGGSYYFLANVFLKAPSRPHQWDNHIGLIWDVSLSGLKRDREKELKLLGAFIKAQKNLTIELGLLNNTFNKAGVFVIRDGNWNALKEKLSKLVYDGGADYSRISSTVLRADEYLFFTDGFSGFGSAAVQLTKPVYTINSALNADFSNLRHISAKSGGQFINLNVLSVSSALQRLSEDELQFIGIKNNPAVTEVYPALTVPVNGYLSVAGIVSSGAESMILQFGYGRKVTLEREVDLNAAGRSSDVIDVSRIWAQKKLSDLETNYDQNKAEISLLGKQFGLVTRNTSLLVLESVDDYIRYGIAPPDELRVAYDQGIKRLQQIKEQRQEGLMEQAIAMASDLKAWWNTDFTPVKVYPKPEQKVAVNNTPRFMEDGSRALNEVVVVGYGVQRKRDMTGSASQSLNEVVVTSALSGKVAGVAINGRGKDEGPRAVISLPEFKSDKDYMKKISGSVEQAYQQYLLIREEYQTTPSFYLDISNWFWQQKDARRSLMILSNLTELDLEDAEVYKTLTYKLRETGNVQAELFTSRKVMDWRPMDAQSYRDYALALADCGYYQRALDTLYSVLNRSYSADNAQRDHGIEEIILAEINNLISLHGTKLKTGKINKKVILDLPVEVRVVMNWNKKDTDIDLWVTDPNGEKCFYGYKRTKAGGRISDDFTAGYGPEQFMIKKAVKGRYKIEVNYYGDRQLSISGATTVMAEIYTNYGRANQERKMIALQLSGQKTEGVFIGEFTF